MRKLFKSYVECEYAYQRASNDATIQAQFINAMMNDEPVGKFRRGPYIARVYRPTSACGGIVALTYRAEGQADYTTVHNLDTWADARHRLIPGPKDIDGQNFRNLMFDVVTYRNGEVSKLDKAKYGIAI